MSAESTRDYALAYLRADISVIPTKADGSKQPGIPAWKQFQSEHATEDLIRDWYQSSRPQGVAILCGKISGFEVLDFDDQKSFEVWCELVENTCPGVLEGIPIVETPSACRHVYMRRDTPAPNQKLALRPGVNEAGKPIWKTLIETRGEGGYVLAPGSAIECHELRKPYRHVEGPSIIEARATPQITDERYNLLISAARSLNEVAPKTTEHSTGAAAGSDSRPGDDFNRRASWNEILPKHGWECAGRWDDKAYWRRPGKAGNGTSATTGFCSNDRSGDLLYVFSSNAAPFEPNCAYSKFRAFALLEHNGDFAAAARELARQGYGATTGGKQRGAAGFGGQDDGDRSGCDDQPGGGRAAEQHDPTVLTSAVSDAVRSLMTSNKGIRDAFLGQGKCLAGETGNPFEKSSSGYDYTLAMRLALEGVTSARDLACAIANRFDGEAKRKGVAYVYHTAEYALEQLAASRKEAKPEAKIDFQVDRVRTYDSTPKVFELTIQGDLLRLTAAQILSRGAFAHAFVDTFRRVPQLPKKGWDKQVNEWLASAELVPMPTDASPNLALREAVEKAIGGLSQGEEASELDQNRAVRMASGVLVFKLETLLHKLQPDWPRLHRTDLCVALRDLGYETKTRNIAGVSVRAWGKTETPKDAREGETPGNATPDKE